MLGMSVDEMRRKYDEIAAFASIGDYINQPVKFYSTGMLARLAFSVQVHLDPDILIVDEALSVGDAEFQAKAMTKIEEILERGTTLLYVGHDLNAVRTFCSRAMRLEKGCVVDDGDPETIVSNYLYEIQKQRVQENFGSHVELKRQRDGFSTHDSDIQKGGYLDGHTHKSVAYGDLLELRFEIKISRNLKFPYIICDVVDGKSLQITGRRIPIPTEQLVNGKCTLHISLRATFQKGIYRLRTRIVEAPNLYNTTVVCCKDDVLSFDVVDDSRELFTGVMPAPMEVRWGETVAT